MPPSSLATDLPTPQVHIVSVVKRLYKICRCLSPSLHTLAAGKAYSAARVGVLEPSANVRPLEEGRCLANGVVRGDGLVFLRQRRAELEELLPEDEPSESAEEAVSSPPSQIHACNLAFTC